MRLRQILPILSLILLAAPGVASADFAHTVMPGESLASVAAQDGLTIDQLAAANGLSPSAQLIAGSTLMIPPQSGPSAPAVAGASASAGATSEETAETAEPVNAAASSSSAGSYVVQYGDTLSAIAARAGVSVAELAAENGLDPNGVLYAGSVLQLGGGSPGAGSTSGTTEYVSSSTSGTSGSAATQPVGAPAEGSSSNPPYPTPETVSASEVGSIASQNGVPPALADAIGWQESGFNNDLVSSADARGVMQILPGTWDWINQTLTPSDPLAPASAASNVRGGVLLLRSLLNSTGGSDAMAAAGYYQGLPSVEQNGMYPSTQQYVNNVLALERQFGGG